MGDVKAPATLLDVIRAAPGERTAVIVPETDVRVTYDSLRKQVLAVADALASMGIGRGDRVAMALPNGLPAIVCFLSASVAGTAAPLNPGYREEEFSFYLEDTAAKLLILPAQGGEEARRAARGKVPIVTAEMDASGVVKLVTSEQASGGAVRREPADASGAGRPEGFEAGAGKLSPPAGGEGGAGAVGGAEQPAGPGLGGAAGEPSADDVALVLHTSGSTGRPKRVPLLHRNLAVSVQNIAHTYHLSPDDVSLAVMPLFHVHGLMASTLATLLTGGTVVAPARFNPLSFWRTVRDYHVTWFSAVPTMHQLLLARLGKSNERPAGAESLRFIRSCSAPLPVEAAERMEAVFGAPVLEAYGMTEASHQMCSNPLPPAARKFGTVGPGTGVQVSIVDGNGRHLERGQQGEVVIQGPNVIQGYENNPEANRTSFFDGWFRTGDEGIIDTDGYLKLVGRIKVLINRGGEKIGPPEIDEVLLSHPAVDQAVTFGMPHPTLGEEVAAAVVLKEEPKTTESELLAFCRERLAEFKCPKKIYLTESIPRTATGKVQRRLVAAAFAPQPAASALRPAAAPPSPTAGGGRS